METRKERCERWELDDQRVCCYGIWPGATLGTHEAIMEEVVGFPSAWLVASYLQSQIQDLGHLFAIRTPHSESGDSKDKPTSLLYLGQRCTCSRTKISRADYAPKRSKSNAIPGIVRIKDSNQSLLLLSISSFPGE